MEGNAKTLFKKFCLEGPIIGLKYFYLYPDKFSRLYWVVNLIGVFSAACLLTFLLYRRFDEMPTRITIENQYEPISSFPYPAITICSPNQIAISSIKHLKKTFVDGNTSANLDPLFPKLLGFYEYTKGIEELELLPLQQAINLNRYSVSELLGSVSQSCENFLKRCYFRNSLVKCSTIFKPILTTHGLCCIFNSWYSFNKVNEKNITYEPATVKTLLTLMRGLTIVADYEPQDAMDRTVLNAGAMRIMFTDWKEFPADDESVLQYSSVEVYNVIKGTYTYCSDEVKGLPTWSRNCLFEDEMRLRYFRQYHNNDCDHMCFVRAVEKQCGCLMPYLPNLHSDRICNLLKIKCVTEVKLKVGEFSKSVECDCPRDCESRKYKVDTIVGNLDSLKHLINDPYVGITFNKSTTVMHFFFRGSVYTKQKQETVMSIISLASNLGGVFGLCIGCSVFTVLEIVFYVYCAIKNNIKKRLRQSYIR